ncbi:MAG: ornithine cyclodeaminase family protein [Bacteroidales bacterium]|jgi:ornithine cyclodeaminase/alanine dehydrogenase-like protein (mu-crystallin family)|nr:ornithine cyclodeaminase family protein [Bacteroidales bacterium]
MLILNDKDIYKTLSLDKYTQAIEEAMLMTDSNEIHIPDRTHVNFKGNTLLLMPSFINKYIGTKLVSVFPNNTLKSHPTIQGIMILNDGETGKPLAVVDGAKLTAMRTGAVGSIGVKYLTDKSADTLCIVGAGIQGFHQALFACSQRPIKTVYVVDNNISNAQKLKNQLSKYYPDIEVIPTSDIKFAVQKSEIIITATTSKTPVIPDDPIILKGKTFIGIGSFKSDMQEFPNSLFRLLSEYYTDTIFAKKETGDLINPIKNNLINENQIVSIKNLVANNDVKTKGTRIFKSVGMALFDIIVAKNIYTKAMEKNIGTYVDF